jgi:hypothetical protein
MGRRFCGSRILLEQKVELKIYGGGYVNPRRLLHLHSDFPVFFYFFHLWSCSQWGTFARRFPKDYNCHGLF